MKHVPTDLSNESFSIETMNNACSTGFFFSAILIAAALARTSEIGNSNRTGEIDEVPLLVSRKEKLSDVQYMKALPETSISYMTGDVLGHYGPLRKEGESSQTETVPEIDSSSQVKKDAFNNQLLVLEDGSIDGLQQNATKQSNSTKRDAASSLSQDRLKLKQWHARFCDEETAKCGHGRKSKIILRQMICEFLKLKHYVITSVRNLKSELGFELPFNGNENLSIIDLLSKGTLFNFIESNLMELEIFMGHPQNIAGFIDTVNKCVPMLDIRESLSKLGVHIQNYVNHLQDLLKPLESLRGTDYFSTLHELQQKILKDSEIVLNVLDEKMPNKIEIIENSLLNLVSTIQNLLDHLSLPGPLKQWLTFGKEFLDALRVAYEGLESIISGMENVVPSGLQNFLSIPFKIPSLIQNGENLSIMPLKLLLSLFPGVDCTCEKIDQHPANSPSPRSNIKNLINSLFSPSNHSVAPSGLQQGFHKLISDLEDESVPNILKNHETTSSPRFHWPNIHAPFPIRDLLPSNRDLSGAPTDAGSETSSESVTPAILSPIFRKLSDSRINLQPTSSPINSELDIGSPTAPQSSESELESGQSSGEEYSSESTTPPEFLMDRFFKQTPVSSSTPSASVFNSNILTDFGLIHGDAPLLASKPVTPTTSVPGGVSDLESFPSLPPFSNLPTQMEGVDNPGESFTSLPFTSNLRRDDGDTLQPSIHPERTDSSDESIDQPNPESESSSPAQPSNMFSKIFATLLNSTTSAGSSSVSSNVCGRSVLLPSLPHLNSLWETIAALQIPLQLPREQVASALGNVVLSPGDLVGIFLRHGTGLIGEVMDNTSSIHFNVCKSKLFPVCPDKGVKLWHVLNHEKRNPVCEQQLKLLSWRH